MFDRLIQAIRDETEHDASNETATAASLGIAQSTLNRILAGKRGIGSRVLKQILTQRPEWVALLHDNGNEPCSNN